MASLFKNKRTTLERIEKFISPIYFKDVNLRGRLYQEKIPLTKILHWPSSEAGRVSYVEAVKHFCPVNDSSPAKEVQLGSSFGPTWSTHWFKIEVSIPEAWINKEVHLLWDADCEAMIWNAQGVPLQGLSGGGGHQKRISFIISKDTKTEELYQTYFIEMACNSLFGAGDGTMISPPNPEKYFTLSVAEIAVFDRDVYNLLIDLELLHDMVKHLPDDCERAYQALFCGNKMINLIDFADRKSYTKASAIAKEFFSSRNGDSQHTIIAIGHCHIDCAWLWPYEETIRKCARSWASTVRLMETHPNFHFACSQAQQFAWVKQYYPVLYEKIKFFVKNGQFIPVGGTWVEMDGNLPSGESFIRQFLYGQHFFKEEFGSYCKEFWLPDTFGYSSQLPQIMKLSNITRFLTQKLSWNLVNKFPHHNFIWEGIDGSSVIVHFPPGDSYEMTVSVPEVVKTIKNLEDKGRVSVSMMLFGHGDGGGGPDEEMLERQIRLRDVDGLPKVKMGTPDEFFSHVEEKHKGDLCKWVGELFLELHNGTYTTQAAMKALNRSCENALHDVELLHSVLFATKPTENGNSYPQKDITDLWKLLLLNQFHDVLPGSSIKQVHEDATQIFLQVYKGCHKLIETAKSSLFGTWKECDAVFIINPLSWQRTELVKLPWRKEDVIQKFNIVVDPSITLQECTENDKVHTLVPIKVVPLGYQLLQKVLIPPATVSVVEEGSGVIVCNQFFQVSVNGYGNITSLKHIETNREAIEPLSYGNVLCMYDDIPLYWDAWDVMDYHLETRKLAIKQITDPLKVIEKGPLSVTLEYSALIGEKSHVKQKIIIDAVHPYVSFSTDVDWKESHKFLKVEFNVNVHAHEASYDIQFGHIKRSTHFNTSWDSAKFEVYSHKWVDLSEYNWGVALLNDSKYGHSVHGNCMRISLLRAPKSPDDTADQGHHSFTYSVMPHIGTFQDSGVIQRACELNSPLHVFHHSAESVVSPAEPLPKIQVSEEAASWFEVSDPEVIISSVKMAEKHKKCLVVRLFEAYGGHVIVTLKSTLPVKNAAVCNAIEDIDENAEQIEWQNGFARLRFSPFQILSLLLTLE